MTKTAGLVAVTIGFLLASVGAVAAADENRPPNILFILIDDLGWMDLEFQGNPLVETPHLNRFSKQGMTFSSAYAAAPVCSPTRASIITGLSPARLRITNHIPDQQRFIPDDPKLLPAKMIDHLPLETVTLAERLEQNGYTTGFIGKWHLSGSGRGQAKWEPTQHGFAVNIGGCAYGGPPTFFDPYKIPNLPDRKAGEYLPDRLADEAIGFIETHQQEPFFLCLWNYTVHWPMEAPQELLDKYQSRKGPGLNDTRYGAMIEAMDLSIGRVLDKLSSLGLDDNTIVVFTSDNGGFGGVADNRPLRKEKGYLYEGGIRIPLVIRWPGVVSPGAKCDQPVISTDFFPTLLEVAGMPVPDDYPRDGVSLVPILKDGRTLDREAIYFHYPNYAFHRSNRLGSAVREGRYKLLEWFDDDSVELYDLDADLSETRDLSGEHPEIAKRLREKLHVWRADVDAAMPQPVD